MNVASKALVAVLVAGWLADALASTDPDVDAGVLAYESEDYEAALEKFDAAKERLGERPEIAFDRGLAMLRLDKPDEARSAFERATEAEASALRGSAHYELGNLSFEAEAWEAAIASYIECLKANPLHENAKWNLELALQKKKEQEEQEEEEQEDQENEDGEQDENEQNEDEQSDEQNEDEQDESDEQEEGEQGEEEQPEGEEGKEDEPEQPEEQEGEQSEDEQEQPEPQPEEGEQEPAEPKPIDRMDVERSLQKLDEQDPFTLDKPAGGYVQPEKDW